MSKLNSLLPVSTYLQTTELKIDGKGPYLEFNTDMYVGIGSKKISNRMGHPLETRYRVLSFKECPKDYEVDGFIVPSWTLVPKGTKRYLDAKAFVSTTDNANTNCRDILANAKRVNYSTINDFEGGRSPFPHLLMTRPGTGAFLPKLDNLDQVIVGEHLLRALKEAPNLVGDLDSAYATEGTTQVNPKTSNIIFPEVVKMFSHKEKTLELETEFVSIKRLIEELCVQQVENAKIECLGENSTYIVVLDSSVTPALNKPLFLADILPELAEDTKEQIAYKEAVHSRIKQLYDATIQLEESPVRKTYVRFLYNLYLTRTLNIEVGRKQLESGGSVDVISSSGTPNFNFGQFLAAQLGYLDLDPKGTEVSIGDHKFKGFNTADFLYTEEQKSMLDNASSIQRRLEITDKMPESYNIKDKFIFNGENVVKTYFTPLNVVYEQDTIKFLTGNKIVFSFKNNDLLSQLQTKSLAKFLMDRASSDPRVSKLLEDANYKAFYKDWANKVSYTVATHVGAKPETNLIDWEDKITAVELKRGRKAASTLADLFNMFKF